jgi:Fe-S-cluster containining protein
VPAFDASFDVASQALALDTLAAEHDAAVADLSAVSPAECARRHQQRYVLRAEAVETANPVACAKGCNYCCHLRVSAPAHEVFLLALTLQRDFDNDARAAIVQRVRMLAERFRAMGLREMFGSRERCGLLDDDGACSTYEVRPSSCRRYHSTSVQACKASFDDPANLASKIGIAKPRVVFSMSHYLAFRKALREFGRDTTLYELNTALIEAIDDFSVCLRRFVGGGRAFAHAITLKDSDT